MDMNGQAGVHARHRLTGAVAGLVCDTKKVTADQKMRHRQEVRQGKRAAENANRDDQWKANFQANPKPQTKWAKLMLRVPNGVSDGVDRVAIAGCGSRSKHSSRQS